MPKGKPTAKQVQRKKPTLKRKRKVDIRPSRTEQPFEQKMKRRVAQYDGADELTLVNKLISRARQFLNFNY